MGSLSEKLKVLALGTLREFTLASDRLGLTGWSEDKATFLHYCIDNKILSEEELRAAIVSQILFLGLKSYHQHIDMGEYPDHVLSPQAFAFAIRHKDGLSDEQVGKIKFDHDENRYTFFKGVEDTLVTRVENQLLGA